MSNALYKDTHATFIPGTPGTVADPGQVARPAYTAYEQKTVCTFVTSGGDLEWSLNESGPVPTYEYSLRPTGGGGGLASGNYECKQRLVPVYYPAQEYIAPTMAIPGTPSQMIYDYNLGWNAGARSNGFVLNDGYVQFEMPYATVGAVLGLNDEDPNASYPNMEHAFYFSGKIARIYELGVQVSYLGPYADGDTFKIVRRLGAVTYYQNGSLVYTSARPSTGKFFLDASLYVGGDYVYDPVIAGLSGSGDSYGGTIPDGYSPHTLRATMLPLVGNGGDVAFAQSAGEMLPLTSDALSDAGVAVPRTNPYATANRSAGEMTPLEGIGSSKRTLITQWPDDVYPDVQSGSVSGVVTGSMPELTLVDGVISGTLTDSAGNVIGFIQGTASGTDDGDGNYTGHYVAVITDVTTGAVIGYVSGALTGDGTIDAADDYTASVTGTATYVLNPVAANNDAATVTVNGTVDATVGPDGSFSGTYTGTITNPVTGEIVGIVTGTVTGTVSEDGTYSGIYTGVVTDPVTGEVIGVITGSVTGTGTLTDNGDGTSSLVAEDDEADSTGTFTPTAPPTTSYVTTYGESHGSLQPLSGEAGDLPPPPLYALGAGALVQLIGAGVSLTGEIGGGATELLPLGGMGSGSPHVTITAPTEGAFLVDTFTESLPTSLEDHVGEVGTGGGWSDLGGADISGVTVNGGVIQAADGVPYILVVPVASPPDSSYYVEATGTVSDTSSEFGVVAVAGPSGEGFTATVSVVGGELVVVLSVDDGVTPYIGLPVELGVVDPGEEFTIRVEVEPDGGGGETVTVFVVVDGVATEITSYTTGATISPPAYVGVVYESSTGGASVTSVEAGEFGGGWTEFPGAGAVTGTISGTISDPTTGTGDFTGTGELTGDFPGVIVVEVVGTVDEEGNFTGTYTGNVYDPDTGELIGTVTGTLTGTVTGTTLVTGPVTGTGTFTPYYEPFNYCDSRGVMRELIGQASALEGNNNASIGNIGLLTHSATAQPVFVAVMNSAGVVTAVIALTLSIDATLHSDVDVTASMDLSSLLSALMQTTVSVGAVVPPYEEGSLVYVVNMDSGASSTYEDYPFNSYALIDGVYYGAKSDGIFSLDGDDDAGTAIDASVSFGKQDFGTRERKRMTAAYVGLSSTGKVYLKVTTSAGDEYIYAARRSDDYLRQQRVDVGRGIEATYISFELFNKDGADFELDTVEFQAVNMTRRI